MSLKNYIKIQQVEHKNCMMESLVCAFLQWRAIRNVFETFTKSCVCTSILAFKLLCLELKEVENKKKVWIIEHNVH
jgi:hypothetical protein